MINKIAIGVLLKRFHKLVERLCVSFELRSFNSAHTKFCRIDTWRNVLFCDRLIAFYRNGGADS